MIELTDMRVLIERMLHRYDLLANARSSMGPQLDILRDADPEITHARRAAERAGYLWARADKADRIHDEFAYLCLLAKTLTAAEYAALAANHSPATPEELADRIPPQTNERIRSVWRGDLIYESVQGGLALFRTRAGEEVDHDCAGNPACSRDDCPKEPERVLVRSEVPKAPMRIEVAARLGLSVHQVGRLISSAYEKIRVSLEERAIRQGQHHNRDEEGMAG